MTSADLIANVRVASPCPARWADMTGDDRTRFCAQCQKHVYNLSEMSAEAAANLIREKEGHLCVRFYRRVDGTVLTADCPVGAAAFARRVKRLFTAGVGLLVPAFAAPLWYQPPLPKPPTRAKIYQKYDATVLAIKKWLNPPPPPKPAPPSRQYLGMVCINPLPRPAPTPPKPMPAQRGQ